MKFNISERTYFLEIAKITGILLWCLLSTISWIAIPKGSTVHYILLTRFLQAVAGYITISLYFFFLSILSRKSVLSKRYFIYLIFPVTCFVSTFWNALSDAFTWLFTFDVLFDSYFHLGVLFYLIPTLAFTGLYYTVNHWLNYKKEKEKALIATNLANEAQLQMLRYQINPHFLFNALNTIRSLVEEDKITARKMITELSNFFRYSLSLKDNTDTFENEIRAVKNYLEIQKIRFEEKIRILYDINADIHGIKLPFFILLPLVENAIKYGLQTSKIPLTIKISALLIGNSLTLSVQNTGKLLTGTENIEGTKTGIENIKRRLDICCTNKYNFNLYEKDGWVISQIVINDLINQ